MQCNKDRMCSCAYNNLDSLICYQYYDIVQVRAVLFVEVEPVGERNPKEKYNLVFALFFESHIHEHVLANSQT